jgi:hypothetical protein
LDTKINNSRNIHGKFNFGSILYKDPFGKKSWKKGVTIWAGFFYLHRDTIHHRFSTLPQQRKVPAHPAQVLAAVADAQPVDLLAMAELQQTCGHAQLRHPLDHLPNQP